MPSQLPLSGIVAHIMSIGHDLLTPAEAREATGRSASTLSEACRRGDIEAHASCVRGRGHRQRWTFSRAALLTYLWNNTTGDKALMRAALKQHCPELLAMLEPPPPEAQAKPLPENVILITSAKRASSRRVDQLAGQMGDLFSRHQAG